MMNPLGFDFSAAAAVQATASASTASSEASASASTASTGSSSTLASGSDHLQRLAAMTQGVGKEDGETSTPSADALNYGAYMSGYGAWPNYYHQFGQPLNPAATFGAWPAHYAAPHWPNYAQTKKGRQTYQRYQTSVLESKFQQSSYVSKKQREELRLQTNLTDRQIKIWFQNRRMKAKKEKHRLEETAEAVPLLPNNPPKPHDPSEEEKKWCVPFLGHSSATATAADFRCFPLGAGGAPSPWGQMVPPPGYPHPGYPVCPPNL